MSFLDEDKEIKFIDELEKISKVTDKILKKQQISEIELSVIEPYFKIVGAVESLGEKEYQSRIKKLLTNYQTSNKTNSDIEFERELYPTLEKWAKYSSLALFLQGPRQVGKTYLLKKLGEECFKRVIYINLMGQNEFANCYNEVVKETHYGSSDEDRSAFWNIVFALYDENNFVNDKDTLVIIDEIQENPNIFNSIREIKRNLNIKLAVTGSYLAFTEYSERFWTSAGDYVYYELNSLSYSEFLKANGVYDQYNMLKIEQDKLSDVDKELYSQIETLYSHYLLIGGYPAIVKLYIENGGNIEECQNQVDMLLNQFYSESKRYFEDVIVDTQWEYALRSMVRDLISKRNNLEASKEFDGLSHSDNLNINRKDKNSTIRWLLDCNILGNCSTYINWNLEEKTTGKYYFKDLGMLNAILRTIPTLQKSDIKGIITENFVYLYLLTKVNKLGNDKLFIQTEPYCLNIKNPPQEIDFLMHVDNESVKTVAIEVKHNKGDTKSSDMALNDNRVDMVIKLQNTFGKEINNKITIPLFAITKLENYLK